MDSKNQDTVESEQPTSSEKPFLIPGATEIPQTKESVELTTDNRYLHWFLLRDFAVIALLWAAYAAVVVVTDRAGILNDKKKYWNSAFTVGIPMIIGLVSVRVYKGMAAVVRWKVLSSRAAKPNEINLILGLDSYQAVTKLGWLWAWEENRYFGSFLCFLWVALMLATTIATALLGLTQDSQSDGALLWRPGEANVTLLNNFYFNQTNKTEPKIGDLANEQYLAHLYGDGSKDLYLNAPLFTSIPKKEDIQPSYGTVQIYQVDGTTDWKYMFQDWTLLNGGTLPFGILSVISNRSVTIKSTCEKYSLSSWTIDGLDSVRNDIWRTGSTEWSMFGPGAVTFMNPDFNPLVDAPNGTLGSSESFCGGSRCAAIGVYVLSTDYHNGDGTFYECNVTVSKVDDPENSAQTQEMNDKVAKLAAGAIGLDGVVYRPGDKRGSIPLSQFVRYNNDTHWGGGAVFANDADEVARLVGGFAAGSIANLDANNPRNPDTPAHGRQVIIGVKINIKGIWLWLIIGLVLGAHLILIPIVLYISKGVVRRDDSYLEIAELLKPVRAAVDSKEEKTTFTYGKDTGKFTPADRENYA